MVLLPQDENLAKHGALDKVIQQEISFTNNGAFGCQVNGRNFTGEWGQKLFNS